MKPIAFATYHKQPGITESEHAAVAILAKRGADVRPAIWNDAAVNWSEFGAVVIRATWDYYLQPQAFHAWLDRLEELNVPVLNHVETLRWNSDKAYLLDLEQRGFVVTPSVLVESGAPANLAALMHERGWSQAVVKPTISAAAHQTWTTRDGAADQARFEADLNQSRVLVQQFVSEICTHGEMSLLFFDGIYSHAVIKLPQTGDFRVQSFHGGSTAPFVPAAWHLEYAQRIIDSITPTPLYGRVDAVEVGDNLMLMELELIEPYLYLEYAHPEASQRFVGALLKRLHA